MTTNTENKQATPKFEWDFDFPQAFGTTRTIIEVCWKQGGGKGDEATRPIADAFILIDGMGAGQFAKYQTEEREMLRELEAGLEGHA